MLFIYYDHKNNTEKTVEIDIDDIMIIHPILGGDTTSVMLKKGDVEYAYVMFNKFDTIPLNNNFFCIYKFMLVYININLVTLDMFFKKDIYGKEVTMFRFKNIEYIVNEYIIRELKIRNLNLI
jgi:hypothetical protein